MNDVKALRAKRARLERVLRGYKSILIAFSGGTDSTFLLAAAREVLPIDKILAVTAVSATYPRQELIFSKKIARKLGVKHLVIETVEMDNPQFQCNPVNRCYFCKSELFSELKDLAAKNKLNVVADAGTVSDAEDFRPGSLAKKELGVRSPLIEAGFSKDDVRLLSRRLGLETWDKPSLACLASRIPYGTHISGELLSRIHRSELCIQQLGFRQVRVRHHGDLCRIEVPPEDIARLAALRSRIVDKLRRLGYNYITIDAQGYRTGSMNESLSKSQKAQRQRRK